MKALHLINRQSPDSPGLLNLSKSDVGENLYFSGFWDIPIAEATALVGGMLFLHEAKSRPSRFGGRVLNVSQTIVPEHARRKRVVFEIQALPEGRGAKWRGADHGMASYGGIIDV